MGRIFPITFGAWRAAVKRLIRLGAPEFTAHALRRTCATVGVNSGIHGQAGVWSVAKRLGHSPGVLERSYASLLRVDPEARTYEVALGLDGAYLATAQARAVQALDAHVAAVGEHVADEMSDLAQRLQFRVLPPDPERD